jgi:hypothetical protein
MLGCFQAQHERGSLSSAEEEHRNLQAQRGIFALVARFFILHASKLVALMLFWAAMQRPGGFGWLLTGEHISSYTRTSAHASGLFFYQVTYKRLRGTEAPL